MKFHILVFGCQMNYADAARIKTVMINYGFSYCDTIKEADIVIFDTCSVRQKAEDKITGKLKEIPKEKKIRITGCMIQHNLRNAKIQKAQTGKTVTGLMKKGNFVNIAKQKNPKVIGKENEDFKTSQKLRHKEDAVFINHSYNPIFVNLQKKFKNLELFFRIDDLGFLPVIAKAIGYDIKKNVEKTNKYTNIIPNFQKGKHKKEYENPATAYIPISTGCNQFCSFCIVPYARGLEKYFSVEKIIEETKTHLNNGAKEITLIGQIVNKHPEFNTIVKEILKLKGLERLRYTSPYPSYYNKELFKLHESEKKLCPHIHMPLQSGSNNILKKMFRGYTAEKFKTFIDQIQSLKRPISITTDIIVGFPGESDEDFAETLNMTKYGKFDMIYIGIYSPRKGTYAEQKMKDDISYKVKHNRRNQLNKLLTETSAQNNKAEEGKIKKILINKYKKILNNSPNLQRAPESSEIYLIQGHTNNMKTVEWKNNKKIPKGTFIKKEIIKSQSLKLFA